MKKLQLFGIVITLLFLVSCGGGGGGGGGEDSANSAPVADAGPDQSVATGSVVTLDGGGSSDADGDLLTYSWSFVSVPTGSNATLSDPAVVNPTFTVDAGGTYVISLIVDDGTVDSTVDTVTVMAATDVGGIINTDTAWTLVDSPYRLTSDIQVAYGSTLTIEPGVVVNGEGLGIKVWGNLNAVASDTLSIVINNVEIIPGISGSTSELFLINLQYQ